MIENEIVVVIKSLLIEMYAGYMREMRESSFVTGVYMCVTSIRTYVLYSPLSENNKKGKAGIKLLFA